MTSPQADYQITATEAEVQAICSQLLADGLPVGIDIETGYDGEARPDVQKHPEEGFIVSMQITNSNRWARFWPLRFDSWDNLDNHQVAEALWPLARGGLLTAWNASFELRFMSRWFTAQLKDHPEFGPQVLAAHNGNPAYPGYFQMRSDPMLEAHAEGKSRSLRLKDNTAAVFGYRMMEIEELFAMANGGTTLTKKEMSGIRFNTLDLGGPMQASIVSYGCDDAVYELGHHHKRYPQVKDSLIYQIEMGILPLACEMMDEGIKLNWSAMREAALKARLFQDLMQGEIQDDLTELLAARGIDEPCRINLRSAPQLVKVLYEQLEMPVHRRTPRRRNKKGELTGGTPSTEADTALVPLVRQFPVIQRIIDYKSLDKLAGTYLEKYEANYSYCPCGRTHPNWMQAGVPAGRWACSAWPVQQSPKAYHYELSQQRLAYDHNFRDNVVAPEGWHILGFDYAQIERRVLAGEAADPALLEAFRSGVDIHRKTAADIFGIPLDQVTKEQRAKGKTTGFGMDYGLGEEGLADRLGITLAEAVALRDGYFAAYNRLQPWTARTVAQARRDGFVLTGGFKRRVPIWEFLTSDRRTQAEGERLAGNAPIQGGAADYMKVSMIRAHAALKAAGLLEHVRLIMNMHDALEFYVRDDIKPLDVIRVLQPAVVWTAPFISHWPPMKAEWHIGRTWGSVMEIILELDAAGQPVGIDVERPKEKPVAEQVAVAPALAGQQAGAPDHGNGSGPGSGVHGLAGPGGGLGPVVITTPAMPHVSVVRELIRALGQRPGGSPVILRTPDGELEIARDCGLLPEHRPEITLMLGMDVEVTRV